MRSKRNDRFSEPLLLRRISEAKTNSHIDESLGCKAWRRLSQPSKSYIYLEKSHIPRTQLTSIFEGQPYIFSVLGFWSGLGPVTILVLGHWTGYIFKIQRFSQEFTTKLLVFSKTAGIPNKTGGNVTVIVRKKTQTYPVEELRDDSGRFSAHEKGALENETLFGRSFYGSSTLLLCEGPPMKCWIFWTDLGEHLLPFLITNFSMICWPDTRKAGHFIWWVRDFFGFWSDCFWILPTISPFESWMYLCFLVNIKKIHVVFFLEHLQVALSPITITHSGDVC